MMIRTDMTFRQSQLKTESPSKLFYDDERDRQFEFVLDKRGVNTVRFISPGLVTELKKVQ